MASGVSSVFRSALFKGKSAIVTGGGTGIGKSITQELLYLGCNVMIASRNVDQLRKTADEIVRQIPKDGPRLDYTVCNIRQEEQVSKLISTTIERFGRIDFLVNNGGGQFPSPAENISLKGWKAVIETNLTGTFLCCREAYNGWMKENGGVIVNIIADMWKGFPGMSHTGAARSGVDNLTKSLAIEWAPAGVRINAIAPGSSIYSPTAAANYKGASANIFEQQIPNIPAKRLGTTHEAGILPDICLSNGRNYCSFCSRIGTFEDRLLWQISIVTAELERTTEKIQRIKISAAVCFLLSPAAAFISGETIKVDGAHSLFAPSAAWTIPDHDKIPEYNWDKDLDDIKKSKL